MNISITLHPHHIAKNGKLIQKIYRSGKVPFHILLGELESRLSVSRHDIKSIFSGLIESLVTHTLEGKKVVTPLGSFAPGLRAGSVPGDDAHPSISSEALRINFVIRKEIMQDIRSRAELHVIGFHEPMEPQLFGLYSAGKEYLKNPVIQPALFNMMGYDLSFNIRRSDEGLFLQPADTRGGGIRISKYSRIGSNHVDFMINGVAPGDYLLYLVRRTPSDRIQRIPTFQRIEIRE
jgi:hypothetical protein